MERPRFSEALVQRRRELGLTTAQASRVLKLKEPVLIAFEEGDFESIPKSGYAQGMVSSYARYLGLDAREIVEMFQEDLAVYEAEIAPSSPADTRARSSQSLRLTPTRQPVDESRRGLLPTSGGRAGDMGDFATTSVAQTRSASVQLVNPNRMRTSGSYSMYDRSDTYDDYDTGVTVIPRRSRSLSDREQPESTRSNSDSRSMLTGDRNTRPRASATYQDDLDPRSATSFEPASTAAGRRQSHRIPQTERPNTNTRQRTAVQRGSTLRSANNTRTRSSRSTAAQTSGLEDILAFVSESRAIIGVGALVVAIVLIVAIFSGIKSCTSRSSTHEPQNVPVTPVISTDTGTIDDTGTGEAGGEPTAEPTTDPTAATPSEENPTGEPINAEGSEGSESHGETISIEVSISVASGENTWLEIMVDGESRIADQVLGPWSETYKVSEQLTVQADNTNAVSVFENGQSRSFETRASGVGIITIKVPVSQPESQPETVPSE